MSAIHSKYAIFFSKHTTRPAHEISEMSSHLCTLPEETLLIIIELLDATSIQCLRRASRVFLRLFSFPCFESQHNHDLAGMPQPNGLPYFPWARPNRAFEAESHTRQFFDCLERDARRHLCSDCKAMGLANSQRARSLVDKLLHCTGCKIDHPLVYFSAAQRQPWCDTTRICIGHEGHVRLCEHLVIGWDTITKAARDLQNQAPGIKDDIASISLLKCQAASHLPTHHECTNNAHPSLKLVRLRGQTSVQISWVGHLALSKRNPSGQYSACLMADELSQLRLGAAEYIAPQLGPGQVEEMRLFDPNRCAFLNYNGTPAGNANPGSWSLTSPSSDTPFQSCRVLSECALHDRGDRGGNCSKISGANPDGIVVGSHVAHTLIGRQPEMTGSEYGWARYLTPCLVSDQCLGLWYGRNITIQPQNAVDCGKVTHAWFEAVNPESYALREDAGTYGTLWCRDKTCVNYYRYMERPVLQRCRRKVGATADWFRTYAGLTADQFRRRTTRPGAKNSQNESGNKQPLGSVFA